MQEDRETQTSNRPVDDGAGGRTGGAGLYGHDSRHPAGRGLGALLGIGSIVTVVLIGGALLALNPSMQTGAAMGTADQIGKIPVAGGSKAAAPEPPAGSPAAEGRVLVGRKGCGSCHAIPGVTGATGSIGPNLAGVGGRTKIAAGAVEHSGPEDLKRWLLNPPALKPGTGMPNVGLSEDEADKIVAYLELLK